MASKHNTCIGIGIGVGPFDLAGMGGFAHGERGNISTGGLKFLTNNKKISGSKGNSRWGAGSCQRVCCYSVGRSGPILAELFSLLGLPWVD